MRKKTQFAPKSWLALLMAAGSSMLVANPQAPQVVRGQASFAQSGSALTVTNTPGTIINWQQFNIDRGQLTRFVQQNAASQVLNRVVGVDPSIILGTLQSNGRVFLVNPNGIVFGAGSQVDVAGLVASTLRLSNDDFINNRLRFTDTQGAGALRNEGNIRTAIGGEVLLVAPRIENSGLIQSPEGKILLAAGRSVEVADIDKPNIRVEITNTDEEAVNLGTLLARSISIYGGLVRNSGRLQASSAVMGENGKIILQAKQRVVLEPTSVLNATGSQGSTGGDISISAQNTLGLLGGGEVVVQGLVSASPVLAPAREFYDSNVPQVPAGVDDIAPKNVASQLPVNPAMGATSFSASPSDAPWTANTGTPAESVVAPAVPRLVAAALPAAMPGDRSPAPEVLAYRNLK